MGREVEPTELEELAVVAEAAKVAGFSQDRQGVDGSNAWDLAKPPVVATTRGPSARSRHAAGSDGGPR